MSKLNKGATGCSKVLTWWLNTNVDIHEWSGADSLLVLGENELVLPPEVGSVVGQHETLVQVLPEVSCKRKQNILTTANVKK